MNQNISEEQVPFEDSLKGKMDSPITFDEAISLISKFYKKEITDIIEGLPPESKGKITKDIIFRHSVNNGISCIRMTGYNEKNEEIWSRLLDKYSGEKQAKIG